MLEETDSIEKLYELFPWKHPDAIKENRRISEKAAQYTGKPVGEWPEFEIMWDFSPDRQHYCLDGETPDTIKAQFPNGFAVGYTSLAQLDEKLHRGSKRTNDEIWNIGCKSKLAKCIVHWQEGNLMTPVIIRAFKDEIHIAGGNHRLAIARARNIEKVPFYVCPKDISKVEAILKSVTWNRGINEHG